METRLPDDDQLDRVGFLWSRDRRRIIRVLVTIWVIIPFVTGPWPGGAKIAFLGPASAIFVAIAGWLAAPPRVASPLAAAGRIRWEWLALTVGVAVAILAVGGQNWAAALIITGAVIGANAPTRWAAAGAACCATAGLIVGLIQGTSFSNILNVVIGPPLAMLFAYMAVRRAEVVDKLRETRAELARLAIANERLRISRDLHDLLGHSLSLITVKAELAGRLIESDPRRASREITDLEAVARRSLADVRTTVTSYRQPSLVAELAEARQLLAAAGMDCQVQAPASLELPPDTDALLAWTVREGVTNAVRHSGARTVTITVTQAAGEVTVEVADDGTGPVIPAGDTDGSRDEPGSGLAGLAERARKAGAHLTAGEGPDGIGFRLLVGIAVSRSGGPGERR